MARMRWGQAKKKEEAERPGSRSRSLEAKANAILGKSGFFKDPKLSKPNKRGRRKAK
jgi:hypothetical protein